MSKKVIHQRDLRLYVNGGFAYPVCLPTVDLSRLYATTGDKHAVTCTRCPRSWAARYPWAGGAEKFTHPAQAAAQQNKRASKKSAQTATHPAPEGPQESGT